MPRANGKKKSARSGRERHPGQLGGDKHKKKPEQSHERSSARTCTSADAQGSPAASGSVGPNRPKGHATQAGSTATQAGSSTTQAGSSTTQAGSSTTQAGSSTTQSGSSTTQAGSSTTQAGSSDVQRTRQLQTTDNPDTQQISTPKPYEHPHIIPISEIALLIGFSKHRPKVNTGCEYLDFKAQLHSMIADGSCATQMGSCAQSGPSIQPASQPHPTDNPNSQHTSTAQPCGYVHTCEGKEVEFLLNFSNIQLSDEDNTFTDYVDHQAELAQRYKKLEVDLLDVINQETLKVQCCFTDEEVNREIQICNIEDAEKAKARNIQSSPSPIETGEKITERQPTGDGPPPNKNQPKENTQTLRRPSVGDIIDRTVDSLYAEADESSFKNSIITLSNIDASFFCILDNELQAMIKWKYQSIMKRNDANTQQLEDFMNIVKEVRLGLSNHETEVDKFDFVFRFMRTTGYHSVEELEETLEAHMKFRVFLEDLIASSSEVEQPVGNVERAWPEQLSPSNPAQSKTEQLSSSNAVQSQTGQEYGSVKSTDQTSVDVCPKANIAVPAFQPFLGDSSVRPKVRQPTSRAKSPKDSKSDQVDEYDPEMPLQKRQDVGSNVSGREYKPRGVRILQQSSSSPELKRPGIGYGPNPIVQLNTVHSPKTETWEQADKSQSVQDVNFDHDLEAIFGEAEDSAGDDYFVILTGIKDNFELAELLQCVLSGHEEPISGRPLPFSPQKIMELFACFANLMLEVKPTERTNKDSSTALSGDSSDVCAGTNRCVPAEITPPTDTNRYVPVKITPPTDTNRYVPVKITPPTGTDETWQSRVRSFYKRAMINKPLEERLGYRPKVTKLTEFMCPKCRERHRWPHILHCCHRFCFPCIVQLYQKDRSCFTCPICLCSSLPSSKSHFGPQSFTIDYIFAGEMFEANLSPFCCTNCSSFEDAVKFCLDCLVYMCQECCLHHSQTESTSRHKLEKTDVKIGAASDGRIVALCQQHPGHNYVKFCNSCWTGVCGICLRWDHKSHEIVEMSDALRIVRQQLNSNNAQILELSKGFQKLLMNLKQAKQDIEALHRAGRHIINKVSNRLHANLEVFRTAAREEIRLIFENIRQQCIRAEAERKIFKEEVDAFRDFVTRYLYFSVPDDMLIMYPVIKLRRDYIEKKCTSNPYLRQRFDFDVRFQPQYPDVTHAIQDLFAALEFEYTSYLSRTLLDSKFVRDRHYVEPYKPPPYSLDYRFQSAEDEAQQNHATAMGAVCDHQEEMGMDFLRQTLPYSRAFGRYGRGDYEFAEPSGVLYLHDCSLAVCDTRNHRILIYKEDGAHLRTIGQPTVIPDLPPLAEEADKTFPRTVGKLYFPYRMAQCPITHNIIVLERPPSLSIQIFSFDGRFIRSFGNPHLQSPRGITVDERGLILILESKTMNFFIFTQEGELIQKSVLGSLEFPNDVVARDGTIYISDNRNHCVKTFDYSLNYKKTFGNESLTYYPISVGFNGQDRMVVTDNHNTFNITIFSKSGLVLAGFKSRARHANCYNVALHPTRPELAVTTKEYQVLIFNYDFNPDGNVSVE